MCCPDSQEADWSRCEDASLREADPEVAAAVAAEDKRQQQHLELIASENHCCAAVMQAAGSVLTDKYAEGYPGRRYYGGCEHVDVVERLAINRAKELFGAEHANVQPHSGSQANMGVYLSVLKPGDTVLGMSLAAGGHLTHGHPKNFSGELYEFISYGVDEDGYLDYEELDTLARRHNPAMIVAGASAYSRTIDFKKFRAVADEVGAMLMVDMAHIAGLVAAGEHPSPVPHADFVSSTTHKTLRGPRGGFVLCREEFARRLDSALFPGIQGGPMMHSIAAKAVAFKLAMTEEFRAYQKQVVANAAAMAEELAQAGFKIVSGGTDNHLFLVNLIGRPMNGKEASRMLGRAHITVNHNAVPRDPLPPMKTSGIRVGSPALTTRGLKEDDARQVARLIARVLDGEGADEVIADARAAVLDLCERFPIPH